MKSVLISIQPKWCELIASGKKTVEVRKTKPKLETPFKCYIYCTNTKPYLVWGDVFRGNWQTEFTHLSGYNRKEAEEIWDVFNGKVIGEFVCDEITPLFNVATTSWDLLAGNVHEYAKALVRMARLTEEEMHSYAKGENCYAWHISNLVIYYEPRELSEFNHCGVNYHFNPPITRPPQSWCYVEKGE